jgi:hypothetical protein
MVVSESWVDGRRKRVVFRTGAIGDTSAPEPQTEVIETELQLMFSKLSRTMKSKERRELRRRIERQMKARTEKRLRKFNGL